MKIYFFCLCLLGLAITNSYAQTSTPQPTPDLSAQMQKQAQQRQELERQQRLEEQRLRALSDMQNSSNEVHPRNLPNSDAVQAINALYRKTTKDELKSIAPDKQDLVRFADFLHQENTGLLRLAADKACADNPNVLVATADCLQYTMPGAGSSYSFRVKDYRIQRLADITFFKNSFQATGIRLHGIFVAVGNIPLDEVNLQTKGAEFLVNFSPETDFQKAVELDAKLIKGVEANGFLYRRAIAAKDNMTYLLRSIAYRGNYWRAVSGFTYNELDLDKREDIIVAFRIVRRYDDGSILILWKRLAKKDSPKTKLEKQRKLSNAN